MGSLGRSRGVGKMEPWVVDKGLSFVGSNP